MMPRHTAAIPKGSSSFFRQIHFDLKLRLVHAWEVFLSSKQSANWSELSAEQSAVAINIPTFISCNKTWRAVIYIDWNFLVAGDFELIAGLSSLNRDTWIGRSAMTKTNTNTQSPPASETLGWIGCRAPTETHGSSASQPRLTEDFELKCCWPICWGISACLCRNHNENKSLCVLESKTHCQDTFYAWPGRLGIPPLNPVFLSLRASLTDTFPRTSLLDAKMRYFRVLSNNFCQHQAL